jgi:SAM-dependent methyltransferase
MGERIVVMNKADGIEEIQQDNDKLLGKIEQDIGRDVLRAGFVPSMIFPGRERSARNLEAWRNFWLDGRGQGVREAMRSAGIEFGFTTEAFAGFFSLLDPAYTANRQPLPAKYYNMLGISENAKESGLLQFVTLLPGKNYDGAVLQDEYGKDFKIFDASFFTRRLADILFSTFTSLLVIVSVSMVLLLFFFYLNLHLTLLTLLPAVFAYICTLGTLRLLHHPLDIPSLMLSVVILGMGIDYAIFCVRAHQRYREVRHPSYVLVRIAVFMSGTSTLIGFGVLCFAEHSVLKSVGITSLLGIGYSLLGTFLLLPPLLDRYFAWETKKSCVRSDNRDIMQRIRARYRTLEAYPRMFIRFKLQYDPMFKELPRMLTRQNSVTTIIDIGCGYGAPACWCLEYFGHVEVYGIDPDPERVRVAAIAAGDRGRIAVGWAPDLPAIAQPADVVLLLDMLHHLDDATVSALFKKSYSALGHQGLLVTRFAIRPDGRPSWAWHLEDWRIKIYGRHPWYRSREKMAEWFQEAGFVVAINEVSTANPELIWIVGQTDKEEAGAGQHA